MLHYNKNIQVNYQLSKKQLEIWGKAQRESARHPKSDWEKLGGKGEEGGRISPASVTWPELKCIGIRRTRFVDLG